MKKTEKRIKLKAEVVRTIALQDVKGGVDTETCWVTSPFTPNQFR